ncbi:MAG: hypothetical protein ACNA7K_03085 [Acholeplasmataceae bacterium]
MKERNLFYFITAVVLSTLFILSLFVRIQVWFPTYGNQVIPSLNKLIIPLFLIWIGWVFESKGFLLATAIATTVLFGFHLDTFSILNGDPFVPSFYAPLVRTSYVLGALLLAGTSGLGYYTYLTIEKDIKA